jgi:diguanylate cyclase
VALAGTALGYRGILEVWSHDFPRGEATLREAWTLADKGFEEIRPLVKYGLALLFIVTNRLGEAEPLLITEHDAASLPDPFTQGCWNWGLALVHHWRGRTDDAIRVLRKIPEAATRVTANRLFNWWVQGLALCSKGDYQTALDLLHQTLATSRRVGELIVRARTFNTLGWLYGDLEDHDRAMEWNRSSLEAVDSLGPLAHQSSQEVRMNALLNLGDDLLAMGRPDEAEDYFRTVESVVCDESVPGRWMAWRYAQHLFHSYGLLCLYRGDTAGALRYADECIKLAEHSSSPRNIAKGRRLRGQALTALGQLDAAESGLEAAMKTAVRLGNPPQIWKTHAALGKLHRARGDLDGASRAAETALSIVEAVAGSLDEASLRSALLRSDEVAAMRRAASSTVA